MNDQIIVACISLGGVVLGAIVASIPIFIQGYRTHKQWLIEKKVAYLKDQIEEIDKTKKETLKNLHNVFAGKKFEDNGNFVSSLPMEAIEAFKKHLPTDKKIMIQNIPEEKRQEIFTDVATALEKKKIELKMNIKKLIT